MLSTLRVQEGETPLLPGGKIHLEEWHCSWSLRDGSDLDTRWEKSFPKREDSGNKGMKWKRLGVIIESSASFYLAEAQGSWQGAVGGRAFIFPLYWFFS